MSAELKSKIQSVENETELTS